MALLVYGARSVSATRAQRYSVSWSGSRQSSTLKLDVLAVVIYCETTSIYKLLLENSVGEVEEGMPDTESVNWASPLVMTLGENMLESMVEDCKWSKQWMSNGRWEMEERAKVLGLSRECIVGTGEPVAAFSSSARSTAEPPWACANSAKTGSCY